MADVGDLRVVYVPGEQASGARELLIECPVAVSDNQFTARMAARTTEELLCRRLQDVADTAVLERLVGMAHGGPNVLLQVAVDVFVNHADLADVEHNAWRLDEVAARLGRPATMLAAGLLSLGPVSDPVLLAKLGWTRPGSYRCSSSWRGRGWSTPNGQRFTASPGACSG